jgi:hypothetical protein
VSHLGDRVSALLDGQLSAEATERAMAHLAGCRGCRDAVEVERLTKARLARLAGPEPTGDLVGRLLAMGGPSGPLPPRPGHVPGSPRPKPVRLARPVPSRPVAARTSMVRPVAVRPPTSGASRRRPGVRRRRARLAGALLGALGVVGAGVGGWVLTTSTVTAGGAGSGVDTLVVQRPSSSTPALGGRGPRFVPSTRPVLPGLNRPGH